MVPLKGLNRAFVAKGLIALRRRENVGLTALMDVARLAGPPEPWHLGFLLGPRINAGGRIGRADLGVRLLLEDDPIEAGAHRRRARPAQPRAPGDRGRRRWRRPRPRRMAALGLEEKGAVVVTAAAGWHPGVVGLVAARLKERFGRPAFAIALEPGGIGTGSGRSIPGVDLGQAVRRAVAEGLLLKGGGHAMAAGVTLKQGRARRRSAPISKSALAEAVEAARRDSALLIDGAVSAGGANRRAGRDDGARGPVRRRQSGAGVALPAHTLAYAEEVGQDHVRARLRSGDGTILNAIAFRAAGQPLGQALLADRGQRGARRRHARDRPLERRGARAVAAHRCRRPIVAGGDEVPARPAGLAVSYSTSS